MSVPKDASPSMLLDVDLQAVLVLTVARMSGKSDKGLSDHPSKTSQPSTEKREAQPFKTSTCITPKNHRFTNLGDAHLAITSRLASRSAGTGSSGTTDAQSQSALGSQGSIRIPVDDFNSAHSADQEPTVEHMEFAPSSRPAPGRSLTPSSIHGLLSNKPDVPHRNPPTSTSCSTAPVHTNCLNAETVTSNGSLRATSTSRAPRGTGSTVEKIYKQYLPSSSSSAASKSASNGRMSCPEEGQIPSPSPSESDGDGIGTHHALGDEQQVAPQDGQNINQALRGGHGRCQMYAPPGEAPKTALPEIPNTQTRIPAPTEASHNGQMHGTSTPQSPSSVSDSQDLLRVVTNGARISACDELIECRSEHRYSSSIPSQGGLNRSNTVSRGCRPLTHPYRQHSLRDGSNYEQDASHCALSNAGFSSGGLTTDSDEDPFKYDRGSYTFYLQPSREREVSAALRRVSGVSSRYSKGTICSIQSTPRIDSVAPPLPPFPLPDVYKIPTSNNPFFNKSNLQFYRNSAIPDPWGPVDDPEEIKIPVRPSQISSSPPACPDVSQTAPQVNGLSFLRQTNTHAVMSDGGEWETVASSVGHFDSNRAYASGNGFSTGSQEVKPTGSSIADYSDTSSMRDAPLDAFSSTDKILQHPSSGAAIESCHLRTLKDTGRPVFLPKPRIHRVNGYPQDSLRIFTNPTVGSSETSARAYLAEKFSAPFRTMSSRKVNNRQNPYENIDQPSKYDFRDSAFSMNRQKKLSEGFQSMEDDQGGYDEPTKRDTHYSMADGRPPHSPVPDESFMDGNDNGSVCYQGSGNAGPSSPCQFSFPLIPLQEAARRQAIRRESGEDDQTFVSTIRTQKNSSIVSSRATQKTTPPIPHAVPQRPTPAYSRRPTTPFDVYDGPNSHHGLSSSIGKSSLTR